jgi:hypothetical protein
MNNAQETLLELIHGYLTGIATEEEARRLEVLILACPESRQTFLRYTRLDAALAGHRGSEQSPLIFVDPKGDETPGDNRPLWRSWFGFWRPATAAAATAAAVGLIFGIFCTSVVWAYLTPNASKLLVLLEESFEFGTAPQTEGIPSVTGIWGGDYCGPVGSEQGVRPSVGEKMLRLMGADYEGKPASNSVRSEVYRVVDLRPYRQEIAKGAAMVQLSAVFNTKDPEGQFQSDALVTLYAFANAHAFDQPQPLDSRLSQEAIAKVRKSIAKLDDQRQTWEKLQAEMRLPAEAEFLVIHLGMKPARLSEKGDPFSGLYLDDIRLSLGQRSPLE